MGVSVLVQTSQTRVSVLGNEVPITSGSKNQGWGAAESDGVPLGSQSSS